MSLWGYKKKWGAAPWVAAFPAQRVCERSELKLRRVEERLYADDARKFVAAAVSRGETCPVVAAVPELRDGFKYGWPISARLNEVHHLFGKLGPLLRWKPGWLAISKQGHRWVHSHMAEARERGWLCEKGSWNDYRKALEWAAKKGKNSC